MLTITLSLSSGLTGHEAQDARAYFNLVAGMSDFGGGGHVTGCGNGPVIPSLPNTGGSTGSSIKLPFTGAGEAIPALLVASAALATGGIFLIVARRRRNRQENV